MSGHSKWSSIKHKKKANDIKKSKLFSKLASNIKTTLKNGADLNNNSKLKNAVSKALENNISKSVISKIISNKKEILKKDTLIYPVSLPCGAVFILECFSDNKNKIISDIKHLFSQVSGSVIQFKDVEYIFNKILKIDFNNNYNEEHLLNENNFEFINIINDSISLNNNKNFIFLNFLNLEKIDFKFSFIFEAKNKINLNNEYYNKLYCLKNKIKEKIYISKIFTNIDKLNFN